VIALLWALDALAPNLPAVLAARSALVMVSTPLGTCDAASFGALGASETLAASGVATVALAIAASIAWTRDRDGAPDRSEGELGSWMRRRSGRRSTTSCWAE
jgi:hypothetical protein